MSRKRRVFDIDMPEEEGPQIRSLDPAARRGPMASAINENAEALKARATAEQAIRAENDALAHEYVALKEAGQVVQMVPLDQVRTDLLVRDRLPGEDEAIAELVTSIRDTGLSNPIRVVMRPDGQGVELVQGFRRLTAYRMLDAEAPGWDAIPALVMAGAEDVGGLYRRMVDENIIRKDLSFAEMAHAACVYAADPATEADTLTDAVAALFQSAPYSKRSYIRSFAALLDDVGDVLTHPTQIPRALGVAVARTLKDAPEGLADLRAALSRAGDAEAELDVLRRHAEAGAGEDAPAEAPARAKKPSKTKTTFYLRSQAGQVKCTAGPGRLEIKVDRDFSSIDRRKLEAAISALVDGLG